MNVQCEKTEKAMRKKYKESSTKVNEKKEVQ